MTALDLAQEARHERGEDLLDARVEFMLDEIGLSDDRIANLAVSAADREKLKGILKRLARQKHPFTQCMRDLRKHRPDLPTESRKRICGRLKSMIKGTGRVKALSLSDDASCPYVDSATASLLDQVDDAALEALAANPINFAALTSKRRKSLPASAFVFPKDRRFPIHDRAHAVNALARSAGTKDERAVKLAVCRRYPDLPACKQKKEGS
jgi:hypothetical protein